jgi:hypothetical protein
MRLKAVSVLEQMVKCDIKCSLCRSSQGPSGIEYRGFRLRPQYRCQRDDKALGATTLHVTEEVAQDSHQKNYTTSTTRVVKRNENLGVDSSKIGSLWEARAKGICRPLRGLGALLECPPTVALWARRYIASFAGSGVFYI